MVLAVFSIKYVVNQIIVGVVLNVLVSGLTGFLFSTVMQADPEKYNSPARLPIIGIPVLSEHPGLRARSSSSSRWWATCMYVAVIVVWIGLFKTRWGLRVRAVGEHPQAADTMGIKVNATRFWNVMLGGAVAGIGGSFFTLVAIDSFTKEISGGRGFIALAAMILGRWNPIGAFFAALLFGFADNLQSIVTIIGTPVPSQFMPMLPYVGDGLRRGRPGGPLAAAGGRAAYRTSRDERTWTSTGDRLGGTRGRRGRRHEERLRAVFEVPGGGSGPHRGRPDRLRLQRGERQLRADPVRRVRAGGQSAHDRRGTAPRLLLR